MMTTNHDPSSPLGISAALFLAALVASADRARAQAGQAPVFFDVPIKAHSPLELNAPLRAAEFVDIDRDGDSDLIFGTAFPATTELWLNDGSGFFDFDSNLPASTLGATEIHACDFDGDGDDDVLMLAAQGISYLGNFGAGGLIDVTAGLFGGPIQMTGTTEGNAILLGDLDGDGDTDVVLDGSISYFNDGLGRFLPATSANPTPANGMHALLDADGDGDLDLASIAFGIAQVLLNDGSGVFGPSTIPLPSSAMFGVEQLMVVDHDGDGDSDLAVSAFDLLLFTQTAPGIFVDDTATRLNLPTAIRALRTLDLEGDGDVDFLVTSRTTGEPATLLRNDGNGVFTDTPGLEYLEDIGRFTSILESADTDGDGDQDLFTASGGATATRLLFQDGSGNFVPGTVSAAEPTAFPTGVLAEDFDQDGRTDILSITTAGVSALQSELLTNAGDGRFERRELGLPLNLRARDVPIRCDLSGDGVPDFAVVTRFGGPGGTLRIYENDGAGQFSVVGEVANIPRDPTGTASGDLNGDGVPDFVLMLQGFDCPFSTTSSTAVVLSQAPNSWAVSPMALPAAISRSFTLGDADGDGDLDLFRANLAADDLLLNDGNGNFTPAAAGRVPPSTGRSRVPAFGDFDDDGDLDLFVAMDAVPDRLLINDGTGTFTDIGLSAWTLAPTMHAATEVVVVDLEGDGRLDLVCAGSGSPCDGPRDLRTLVIYLNQGNNQFLDVSGFFVGPQDQPIRFLDVADLDGDGRLDILTSGNQAIRILFNSLTPRLSAPRVLQQGQPYTIDLRSNALSSFLFATLLFSPSRGPAVATPFGTFGLDPATTGALQMARVVPPGQVFIEPSLQRVEFTLAANPSLVGLEIHWQAIGDVLGSLTLSNVVSDVVIP